MSAHIKLPRFNDINLDEFSITLDALLKDNLEQIDLLLAKHAIYTWENLIAPLEDLDDKITKLWSPISHLHSVVNSAELRACYQACLPKFSTYSAKITHNERLYRAIKSVDLNLLNPTQVKIIQDELRDFELAGVALKDENKKRFEEIQLQLSELSNRFENNILDATLGFELYIDDPQLLEGLPEHTLHHARALGEEKGKEGYILNLEPPSYIAVMTHADNRELREQIYYAYVTRASDEGPNKGEFDNSKVMDSILALRDEKAKLLGFNNYTELSLATKMANSSDEVVDFLNDLAKKAHPQAVEEVQSLKEFAKEKYQIDELKPWDVAYLSEKKRELEHGISEQVLRQYFPLPKVFEGLFSIIKTLFNVSFKKFPNADVWHKDVECYELYNDKDTLIGFIYIDLFARPHKRAGAWMDSLQGRRKLEDETLQLPIALLTCNFTKAMGNKPAMLSHDEVITLFHEMGHCLHHLLTKVDYLGASGMNGVEWDAVELPSQFLENWCWEKEALDIMTAHTKTNEALPQELFQKMIDAKNFQSAMAMMRQLEFSIFDFKIHKDFVDDSNFIANVLENVRKETTVTPIAKYNRFQHSFSHIFAGGYAAGYYSYKWAEVLSSDAFSRFEEEGVFNTKTGTDFRKNILEVGGSMTAEEAYVNFRGRKANTNALLRHNGINV